MRMTEHTALKCFGVDGYCGGSVVANLIWLWSAKKEVEDLIAQVQAEAEFTELFFTSCQMMREVHSSIVSN